MAWTGIKVIRDSVKRSVDYVQDEEKTALCNSVDYAFNRDKTETTLFESAINCCNDIAYQEMMAVKQRFCKEDGVQGYHLVQSFKTDEVIPEQCHALGMELAKRLLPEGYQAVVCSHLNTDQYHNHIVWNSVNSITGKKYHINERDLYMKVRRISDELCKENGLSVIEPKRGSRGMDYYPYMLQKDGHPLYRDTVKLIIDKAINDIPEIITKAQLFDYFREQGYEVNDNPRHKYVTVLSPGSDKVIRLGPKLGKGYSMEDILERLANKKLPKREHRFQYTYLDEDAPEGYIRTPNKTRKAKYRRIFLWHTSFQAAFSLKGLRAMYFDYLHRMGVRLAGRRIDPSDDLALKSDIAKLDARIRQMRYLSRTGFETTDQLQERISELQQQAQPLLAERKKLYRKPNSEAKAAEIALINERLRPIWAEIYLCRDIDKHSKDIGRKLNDIHAAQRSTNIPAHKHKALNTSQYYDNIIS